MGILMFLPVILEDFRVIFLILRSNLAVASGTTLQMMQSSKLYVSENCSNFSIILLMRGMLCDLSNFPI